MINIEYPPIGGGAGNANYYLLKEFSKHPEVEIDLVTSAMGKYCSVEKYSQNITIHKLSVNKKYYQFWKVRELALWTWKASWYTRKLIKKKNFDLCHCWFGWPSGLIGYLYRKKLPYIVGLRGSDVPGYNPRTKYLDKLFLKKLSIIVWKHAAKLTANSKRLIRLANQTYKKKTIHLIYNGIDANIFKPISNRADMGLNIVFVGRLIKRKGLIYLLKAFKELCDEYDHCKLQIVGSGPVHKQLEHFCQKSSIMDRVEFSGRIMHNDIFHAYRANNVFIIPSLEESHANSVLEAMACGLAIISTNSGAAEHLDDNGFIVKKKNQHSIKCVLTKYAVEPELVKQHGKKSRNIALQLNWARTADKFLHLYNDVIHDHGGKAGTFHGKPH